jgi:diguanylate cyclase (GGDEF)-like protein
MESADMATTDRRASPLAHRIARPSDKPSARLDIRVRELASRVLPRGRRLPDEVWAERHVGLAVLLWMQAPALFGFALYRGYSLANAAEAAAPIAACAMVAVSHRLSRRLRSASVAVGLVVACSILVDLSGGAIEAHFSYFVVIAFLTLYQEWMPYLIAIVFVLLEHGIVGVLAPSAVYQHPVMAGMVGMVGKGQDPWKWALIHAGFVLAASIANLLAWRLTEQEALHDSLTGLPNRVLFTESVELSCEGHGRATTAVLFIDLDNFKDANDGFGHANGDRLLRGITDRLRAVARYGDVVARLGGDEFGVVLRNVKDEDEGFQAAERYLATFEQPFEVNGLSMVTSASVGLVYLGRDSTDVSTVMGNADLAMYAAKHAGGAQVCVFEPEMHDVVVARAKLQVELRRALARDEFILHYQPLIDVASGEHVGNEALVRWRHPERGLVPPGEFISIAEESDLIIPLGRWVLRTACAQTFAWHTDHPDERPVTVSVNLSPRQLADRQLIDTVANALADSGLPPGYLCLEITEGAVIKDLDGALPKLRALKAIGVCLALDDFGTGYSSLSYLRQLPVDSLKIDQSFIADLTADGGRRIVKAIVDLAHAFGVSVTAEGVETEGQLAVLHDLAADLAQGYLLGRPMAPDQMSQRRGRRDPVDYSQPVELDADPVGLSRL